MHSRKSHQLRSEFGGVGSLVAFLIALSLGLYLVLFVFFGYRVGPGEIGVRQVKFGPWQGFSNEGLIPGIHWGLPGGFYTVVHRVPQTVQILNFHQEGSGVGNSLPSLEIQTADRASVYVDVTVLTRFYPSSGKSKGKTYQSYPGIDTGGTNAAEAPMVEHGGPADLIKKVGTEPEVWLNHIRRTSEEKIRNALGAIPAAKFYDPAERERQLAMAFRDMNRSLAEYGVSVESLFLRRFRYRDDRIDQAIFQKNLQEVEKDLNVAAGSFAQAQAALEQVAAEWDAKIQTLRVESENRAHVVRSEGDLYENEKKANGDLEVARAKAEVDRLKATVLARSHGAEAYVARELASMLGSLRGGVISGVDPYDLDQWAKRFGIGVERAKGEVEQTNSVGKGE